MLPTTPAVTFIPQSKLARPVVVDPLSMAFVLNAFYTTTTNNTNNTNRFIPHKHIISSRAEYRKYNYYNHDHDHVMLEKNNSAL